MDQAGALSTAPRVNQLAFRTLHCTVQDWTVDKYSRYTGMMDTVEAKHGKHKERVEGRNEWFGKTKKRR